MEIRSQDVVAVDCLLFGPLRGLLFNNQLSAFTLDTQSKQKLANCCGFGSHLFNLLAMLLLHGGLRLLFFFPLIGQLTLFSRQLDIFTRHENSTSWILIKL